jgi:signal transduction histidine kinase/CheY-like chemotaxis protein
LNRLLLLDPRTSNAAASCPGDNPTIDTQLSVKAAKEDSTLFKSREARDFEQTLEAAEEEARNINAKWKLPNKDLEIPGSDAKYPSPKQVNCNPENGRVQYSYDIQSANEEVLSNVKEVQRFNEELELAKEEAQAINDKWGQINEEPTVDIFDSGQALDLVISIIEIVREPLVILDNDLCVKKANRAFHRTFRHSEKDTEALSIYGLAQGAWNIPSLKSLLGKVLMDSRAYEEIEVEVEYPQVGRKTLRLNVRRLSGGEMILMAIRDVTPRRRTEVELSRVQDELRQGQKMEVIGRLAGGVAHDFNNILTGILGFSEILMDDLGVGTEAYHQAAEIKKASERAAALTQQLLAFSRRQVLRPQVVNLNAVILGLSEMLRRLIGDNIRLNNALDEKLGALCADPGQIGQVILNLALNARDAMTKGGTLSIRTENIQVDEIGERIRGLAPGKYVSLTVTDSGTGMDHETQQHIFEPFYTTKPQGSGTGLGLATVFGVVNQSGGHIQFTSELNCGTTFWIDFPRVEGSSSVPAPRERAEMLTGTETILVVEDDELVRELVLVLLQRQGYTVLDVGQADEALAMCESYPSRIDLILTDLLMPGEIDGRDLAAQVLQIRPGIRVLLMSGYTTDAMAVSGVQEGVPFLQKPFTQQELAGKVREVLNNDGC